MDSHGSQRSNYSSENNPYQTIAQKCFIDKAIMKTAKVRKSIWGNNDLFVHEYKPRYPKYGNNK